MDTGVCLDVPATGLDGRSSGRSTSGLGIAGSPGIAGGNSLGRGGTLSAAGGPSGGAPRAADGGWPLSLADFLEGG